MGHHHAEGDDVVELIQSLDAHELRHAIGSILPDLGLTPEVSTQTECQALFLVITVEPEHLNATCYRDALVLATALADTKARTMLGLALSRLFKLAHPADYDAMLDEAHAKVADDIAEQFKRLLKDEATP